MLDKTTLMLRLASPTKESTVEYKNEYKELCGIAGEIITRNFLDLWNTQYFHIEQSWGTKPVWLSNGKRPDFIAFTSDPSELILIDAKFHTPYKNKFRQSKSDLNQYKQLVDDLASNGRTVNLIFIMPIGGVAINSFYCYTLEDFLSGSDSEDGNSKLVELSQPFNALEIH